MEEFLAPIKKGRLLTLFYFILIINQSFAQNALDSQPLNCLAIYNNYKVNYSHRFDRCDYGVSNVTRSNYLTFFYSFKIFQYLNERKKLVRLKLKRIEKTRKRNEKYKTFLLNLLAA